MQNHRYKNPHQQQHHHNSNKNNNNNNNNIIHRSPSANITTVITNSITLVPNILSISVCARTSRRFSRYSATASTVSPRHQTLPRIHSRARAHKHRNQRDTHLVSACQPSLCRLQRGGQVGCDALRGGGGGRGGEGRRVRRGGVR